MTDPNPPEPEIVPEPAPEREPGRDAPGPDVPIIARTTRNIVQRQRKIA